MTRNFVSLLLRPATLLVATCVLAGARLLSVAQTPAAAPIQVPAGFEVIRVAAPPLVGHPTLGGFDDRGRLFVAENAGVNLNETALAAQPPSHIRVLEDTDGDGIFDRSTLVAGILTFPQGGRWLERRERESGSLIGCRQNGSPPPALMPVSSSMPSTQESWPISSPSTKA